MRALRITLLSILFAVAVAPSARAQACMTSFGPCVFPPGSCAYVEASGPVSYAGGHSFSMVAFEGSVDCAPIPADGVADVQVIHTFLVARWTPSGGPTTLVGGPAVLTMRVVGGSPSEPRPFTMELLAMDLSGVNFPPGVGVRESPTQASPGLGVADEDGPGNYVIVSFFDVFTELTLDGGQTWAPANQSQRERMNQGPPLPARTATWGSLKATYR